MHVLTVIILVIAIIAWIAWLPFRAVNDAKRRQAKRGQPVRVGRRRW